MVTAACSSLSWETTGCLSWFKQSDMGTSSIGMLTGVSLPSSVCFDDGGYFLPEATEDREALLASTSGDGFTLGLLRTGIFDVQLETLLDTCEDFAEP